MNGVHSVRKKHLGFGRICSSDGEKLTFRNFETKHDEKCDIWKSKRIP